MTIKQHTPGPWHAYPADYQRAFDGGPLPIFVVGPREFHTVAQVRAGCDDDDLPTQTEANARLIAAAPELLDALCEALSEWDGFSTEELKRRHLMGTIDTPRLKLILQARAAVAKAAPEPSA